MTPLKPETAIAIYRAVQEHQPCRIRTIAQALNLSWHAVAAALPAVANNGLLLTEDDKGLLYTFYSDEGVIPCLSPKIRQCFISSVREQTPSSQPATESPSSRPT